MQTFSVAEAELIRAEYRRTQDINRISRRYGLPISVVKSVIGEVIEADYITKYEGLGRPEMRRFIVSRKHCKAAYWPDEDLLRIEAFRQLYDRGEVEMCQGRDGEWFILYAIPRKQRVDRHPYFSRNFAEE